MLRAVSFLLVLLMGSSELCMGQSSLGFKEPNEEEAGGERDGTWLTGAHEMQNLAQLSWEYVEDLQCWLWPEKCEGGKQTYTGSSELCMGQSCLDSKEPNEEEAGGERDRTWLTGAHEMQDLAQLSWEYVEDLQCWLWPEKCEGEKKTYTGWSWPSVGWNSLQILSDWYSRGSESRITNNLTGLHWDLSRRVHGQHLAGQLILSSIQKVLRDDGPKRSLALSFHGWTGTGKNLAARIIAENLYQDGLRSLCVRVFIPQLHFPHLSHVEAYKVQLENQIREVSSRCPQPLFVFDEADKLPVALLTSLPLFLSPSETPQSRSIFIFLSDIGVNAINEVALRFWRDGRHREEITVADLDRPLRAQILESKGDKFLTHHLLAEGFIDVFVPFLPLERSHVKLCARDSFLARGLPYTETALEMVTQELLFVPKEEKLFSAQGCKLVAQRINFMELLHKGEGLAKGGG
ncbi:torsin-3A [Ascaphus truei]|uniref:torsin-3A n=1 Tax=Ascaphus truei TaxID=8439 RepID=UPI003F590F13